MNPATRRRIGVTALAIVLSLIVILCVAQLVDRGDDAGPTPVPAPSATAATRAPSPARVTPSVTGAAWEPTPPALPEGVSYAYTRIDTTNGSLQLGGDVDPHPFDKLIVPGLAQDYLRQLELDDERRGIQDEDRIRDALGGNATAIDWLTEQVGGAEKAFSRIVSACQLDDADTTTLSAPALDIARYGACLREGVITDADSATWVLEQMRAERGGIGETRGDAGLAQQNSTVLAGDKYQAGCLAVGPWWIAAILVDYDRDRGEPYGRSACALIAGALLPPDTQKVPERKTSPAPSVDAS